MPQTPCPEVQPFAIRVPSPTSAPAITTTTQFDVRCVCAPPKVEVAATPADGVTTGTEVTFDASGSSSPKGNALNYTWELTVKPTGSVAVLSGTETVTTTVTPQLCSSLTRSLIDAVWNLRLWM